MIDTQTLSTGFRRLPDTLAHIRQVLTPDGVFVSVPVLGTPEEAAAFLSALREAGFALRRFEFVRFRDVGQTIAYPVIETDLSGSTKVNVDLEGLYGAVLQELQGA